MPTGWAYRPTPPPPHLTPRRHSAVRCCPPRLAGLHPPVPAAAAAPAPPGPGRQPPAGQSCPGSWCPPAGEPECQSLALSPSQGLAGCGEDGGEDGGKGSRGLGVSPALGASAAGLRPGPHCPGPLPPPISLCTLAHSSGLAACPGRHSGSLGVGRAEVEWRLEAAPPPTSHPTGCPHFCSPWRARPRPGWRPPQAGRPPGRRG